MKGKMKATLLLIRNIANIKEYMIKSMTLMVREAFLWRIKAVYRAIYFWNFRCSYTTINCWLPPFPP